MDINELESYRLSNAVKFHNELNPRLWRNENLRPEVREKLLAIADDFREFLGIDGLDIKDITVSGSNAAYTYTPHSDIDLHLVVDLDNVCDNEVYRELFDAKKYQYNNEHNYKIRGYDVELYVQDSTQPHHSAGIYSVVNDDWVKVPSRRQPTIDDISVKGKYVDLGERIEAAIASGDTELINNLWRKVKSMRQAGLDTTGEFGPENLAFKLLRRAGVIEKLKTAVTQARDQELSLNERKKKKKKVRYGYGGYFYPGYSFSSDSAESGDGGGGESVMENKDIKEVLRPFVDSCVEYLDIEKPPKIILKRDPEWTRRNGTFGRYDQDAHSVTLAVTDRHTLDILRTLAHELTHARQSEQTKLPADAGETGSPYEDEANAMAGRIMRHWADQYPEFFKNTPVEESIKDRVAAVAAAACIAGTPGCATTSDAVRGVQAAGTAAQTIKRMGRAGAEVEMMQRLRNELRRRQGQVVPEDYDPNGKPPGPEFKPTMPAGTVKVNVSDVYDWYKLGQHISDLDGLGKHDFGQGPPSAIMSFGDEDTEHKYIKNLEKTGLELVDVDPVDVNQPKGMPKLKTDPTYNVNEAFDQPYPIKWEKSEYGDYDALATLEDGTHLSIMFEHTTPYEVAVSFWRNNSQEVTGEGDAQRIFATVLAAIQQFLKQEQPANISFSAVKEDDPTGSRSKLYKKLVQRYAGTWGYQARSFDHGDKVEFELSRLKQAVAETQESCPECGGPMFSELLINEKQDACYYKVKSRYKVWPSAYASGALVQCRKKGADNWGNKK